MTAPTLLPMFITADLAKTRAFYVDKLGCKVVMETECYLQVSFGDAAGGATLAFGSTSMPGPKTHKAFGGEGVTLSVAAADVDGRHKELVARGVTISDPPADRPWGWRSFVARDPNGVQLDFYRVLAEAAPAHAAS